ncbi:hypothetical protein KC19_10G170700 [Ceratodon purpureus]|uniref:Uncharacterized protein n=1 Tax=Ceratodon purpureus TaxID=3225 RepID=A0A8T0GRJ4_CERPU|nr:hypothetical protein KC19_10G170700 [Ceratodon purpureus]
MKYQSILDPPNLSMLHQKGWIWTCYERPLGTSVTYIELQTSIRVHPSRKQKTFPSSRPKINYSSPGKKQKMNMINKRHVLGLLLAL